MNRKVRTPGRVARAQARTLLDEVKSADLRRPETSGGFVRLQVSMLSAALDHLLSHFDYEAEIKSHAAIAARMIALSLDQAMWVRDNQLHWAEPLATHSA
jgi:hypothetical protein